jgi:hypothetical protein
MKPATIGWVVRALQVMLHHNSTRFHRSTNPISCQFHSPQRDKFTTDSPADNGDHRRSEGKRAPIGDAQKKAPARGWTIPRVVPSAPSREAADGSEYRDFVVGMGHDIKHRQVSDGAG